MSYDEVIDALGKHNLSWNDIDRIHLRQEAYDEFLERASFNPANYETTDKPAVRRTTQEQVIYYIGARGHMQEISLD